LARNGKAESQRAGTLTARANGVEPFEYLSCLFEHLPSASTVKAIEALLPWSLKTGWMRAVIVKSLLPS
jgi:IS66 C-terminal element